MTVSAAAHAAPATRSARHQGGERRRRRGFFLMLLGFIGELLITAGLFVGLFVVWQLVWTSVEVRPEMTARIQEFQAAFPVGDGVPEERKDEPPTIAQPTYGETFGVLHVPKWKWAQIPITEGTGLDVLDRGHAGHYEFTQLPGEIGNFGLAGHRRTYGDIFLKVDILEPGDPIVVETENAFIVYRVTGSEIILPHESRVLLPVPNEPGVAPTKRVMTMTTCHPDWGISHRFVVYSEFAYWTDKTEGKPAILRDEPPR